MRFNVAKTLLRVGKIVDPGYGKLFFFLVKIERKEKKVRSTLKALIFKFFPGIFSVFFSLW